MPTLSRELRRVLENAIVDARRIAKEGAQAALESLAVSKPDPFGTMFQHERDLRQRLRARGHQLGDARDRQGKQSICHLTQACAYEHWHRMLFARFLAENGFLLDPHYQLPLSMDDVQERARELGRDWLDVASEFAQRMLLDVFRPGDPVLEIALPPEKRQQLESKLEQLPADIFIADDSLGWVYQFWQREEKEKVDVRVAQGNSVGPDELPAKTQLFTEDYMVLFLLHNTLGAWWTARRGSAVLDGYEWAYLRLNEDGTPAAASFDGWPKRACELRVLDPCMGSGHFLTFALPILARMRMVEENLTMRDAIYAAVRDNLFGLELDARCSQIAAFNLALTAWRLAGELFSLPRLNLACSGLGINASEAEWMKLANGNSRARTTMQKLYELLQKSPTLGSLIDPTRIGDLITARFDEVRPLLKSALEKEKLGDEEKELAITAQGLVTAVDILAAKFTLVATNVPYLGRPKQNDALKDYSKAHHDDAKADLATTFLDRSLRLCRDSGSVAVVTKHELLFQPRYKAFRERLLRSIKLNVVARLGEHAFESSAAAGAFAALIILSNLRPADDSCVAGLDVGHERTAEDKGCALQTEPIATLSQFACLRNPDAVISVKGFLSGTRFSQRAFTAQGFATSDNPPFIRMFWELPEIDSKWQFVQSAPLTIHPFTGLSDVLLWEEGTGHYYRHALRLKKEGRLGGWKSGVEAWGKKGVLVAEMRGLPCTLYSGSMFDHTAHAIVPRDASDLPAIWTFCCSTEFRTAVRQLSQKLNVTNETLVKIPFDLAHWQEVAQQKYPHGLPLPHSDNPTQWLFDGQPRSSIKPLQVAVARLLGYRWPRQRGLAFPDAPSLDQDRLQSRVVLDGIVCLASIHGNEPAHIQLRTLLADTYGRDWSAQKLGELVGDAENLENWLSRRFFREHCELFQSCPFIWHVWDGRTDGFNALVNYHKLAGPNGEGRRTLERLIYTYLSDWIRVQESQIGKVDGADARLVAAQHLRQQLEAILKGEPPFDIFVRWKPIHQQPIGWEPDLNDGVRLNMRPWLEAKPYKPSRRDACILRETPIKLPLGKDRGKEPSRDPVDFPWFAESTDRTNDIHLTIAEKQAARDRKTRK
ncbi:MAG: Eco57I restriction-modification methylase domain-containing protein [Candidatus Acidiferrales bacterium]